MAEQTHISLINPIIVAPSCDCGLVMDPHLMNVTNFGGPVTWHVSWVCPARFNLGHDRRTEKNNG